MADRDLSGTWLALALSCAVPGAQAADGPAGQALDALQSAPSRIHDFLKRRLAAEERRQPDWILEQSQDAIDPLPHPGDDAPQLVLQQDRRDGAELLTLRYPLAERGAWRTYAGAGLNQAVYYQDGDGQPALLNGRSRDRSLGAAAELGAELRFNGNAMLQADVRWVDLASDAILLRSEDGLVGADAVCLGLSVGWRFR
jgi:hypothetical protein